MNETDTAAHVLSNKLLSNWITTELLGRLKATGKTIKDSPVTPQNMGKLICLIHNNTISGKIAKTVFDKMFNTGKNPEDIIKENGLIQINDESQIKVFCDEAISENAKAVSEYKNGKERAIGALIGSVMKKSSGQANPQLVSKILREKVLNPVRNNILDTEEKTPFEKENINKI